MQQNLIFRCHSSHHDRPDRVKPPQSSAPSIWIPSPGVTTSSRMPPRTMLRVVSLLPSATEVLPVFSILLAHLSACPITLDVLARLDIPCMGVLLWVRRRVHGESAPLMTSARGRCTQPHYPNSPHPTLSFSRVTPLHATNPSVPMRELGTAGPPSPAHASHRSCQHQTSDSARKAPKLESRYSRMNMEAKGGLRNPRLGSSHRLDETDPGVDRRRQDAGGAFSRMRLPQGSLLCAGAPLSRTLPPWALSLGVALCASARGGRAEPRIGFERCSASLDTIKNAHDKKRPSRAGGAAARGNIAAAVKHDPAAELSTRADRVPSRLRAGGDVLVPGVHDVQGGR